ncbi:DUF7507 domain-containing protein [Flavilitoribacter nigricans]|uniref:Uncharacterized protein n=1 Tax=Flavilitoribacter nigricans (strain ATCC 23147 / DSM 23189 / NBRC 102662 / NCIMB 1420 / SS-2) TaxID=1122177 RepID=A0A2D0N1U4_FLAN2|nr:carboxypeptidase regulatory-like domain-containing protein [Flavilitoribacter nigricans]PHN02336.1 hypothetical protein CRP01_32340 [Flavilitoribacter nigricans DSM 23189 = NBRC 102662]
MKKLLLLFTAICLVSGLFAQRTLEWSIGEIDITCGEQIQICYPLLVAIDDGSQSPELSTSTMRIFYDAGYLTNLSVTNVETGYTINGFNESADVYGGVFNFTGGGGIFAQFDLISDNSANAINLTATPTHVLDFCFTVDPAATFPLCAPIVFDNNHCGWDAGIAQDDGYLVNDAGIVGTYFLNADYSDVILADDEVINYLWEENPGFDCRVDALADNVGMTSSTGCIEDACNAAISIVKTSDLDLGADGVASVGDIITYTYTVINTGPATLYDVTVDENAGSFTGTGLLPAPGSENITVNGGSSSDAVTDASIDVLSPGDEAEFTATYAITQADIDAGSVTNQATATGTPLGADPVTDDSDDNSPLENDPTVTTVPSAGSIDVTKTDVLDLGADGVATVGDVITYSFVITNTGNVTLDNIVLSDADVTLDCDLTGIVLAPGQNTTCSGTYMITQADIDAGIHVNSATVDADDPNNTNVTDTSDDPDDTENVDPNGDGNPDDPTDTPLPSAGSIDVTKTDVLDLGADGVATVGDVITYTFVITNTGNVTLDNIVLTDADVTLDCDLTGVVLAPGQNTTCSGTYMITQADIDAGIHVNSATVDADDPNNTNVTDTSDDPDDTENVDPNGDGNPDDPTDTPLPSAGSIDVTKTDVLDLGADGVATVGDVITYSFVITNTGNVTLDNIVLSDADVTLDCDLTGVVLAPGQNTTCSGTYMITQADIDAGIHVNSATVDADDPNDNNVTDTSDDPDDTENVDPNGDGNPDDPTDTPLPSAGSIDVTKTDVLDLGADGVATVGDVITYTFVITNTGNVTLDNIVLTDADVTLDCDLTGVVLAPGQNTTCSGTYMITQADIDAGIHVNSATVDADDPNNNNNVTDTSDDPDDTENVDPNGDGNPDDPTDTPLPSAGSIDVTKTDVLDLGADGVATVGDVITYSFVITNTGNVTLDNIVLSDADVTLDCDLTGVVLAPGQNTTCSGTYMITQADIDAGIHVNSATVDADDPNNTNVTDTSDDPDDTENVDPNGDGNPDDPTDTPLPSAGSIDVTKTDVLDLGADGVATVGDVITYSFVITNTGNVTLDNIVLTDADVTLDCDLTGVVLAPGQDVTCSGTYLITQADIDEGIHVNSATVDSDDPNNTNVTDTSDDPDDTENVDPNGDGNPDDPTDTPLPSAGSINVTKTDALDLGADGVATVGDVITYSFVITNTGNVTLDNIVLSDADVTLNCDLTGVVLAPGENTTCSGTYMITQADIDAGIHVNSATVDADDPNNTNVTDTSDDPDDTENVDPNGDGNPDDPTDTPLPSAGSIDVTKTDVLDLGADGVATVGDVITYSFVITNTGNVTLDNIVLSDADVTLDCDLTGVVLAPGQDVTCSGTYMITQADIDAGIHVNSATVDADDPNDNNVTDTSDDPDDTENVDPNGDGNPDDPTDTPLPSAGSIDITKTDVLDLGADGVATVGDVITYSFVITNTGNVTLDNIVLSDADVTLDCDLTGVVLAPGQDVTCSGTYMITQADIDAGIHVNSATVDADDPNNTNVTDTSDDPDDTENVDPNGDGNPDDPTDTPLPSAGSIDVTKTDVLDLGADGVATVGDVITYSFVITNTGNVTLDNIVLSDADVTLDCDLTGVVLAPGQNTTCSGTYMITQADIDAGIHVNSATVDADDPNDNNVTDSSDDPDDTENVDPNGDGNPDDPTETIICPVIEQIVATDPVDCDSPTGRIEINASGANLLYSINGGASFSTSSVFIGLEAGTYDIVVKSDDCETDGGQVVLTAPGNPSFVSANTINPDDCDSPTGSITITSDTPVADTEYSIDGGVTWQSSNTFTGLIAGYYEVFVRNNDGTCATAGPVIVLTQPNEPILLYTTTTNPTTCDGDNGTITVVGSGGEPPYQFSKDGGANWTIDTTEFTFTGLTAGDYQIAIRNSNGTCEIDPLLLTLDDIDKPTIVDYDLERAMCLSGGSATLYVDGGEILGSYRYSTDGVTWTAGGHMFVFSDLGPGTHTLYVQNGDGSCTVALDITILSECLELEKTADPLADTNGDGLIGGVGDVITYSFTVTNTGDVPLTSVNIVDNTAGVFVANSFAGTLNPGESYSGAIAQHTITAADVANGSFLNQATVSGQNPENQPVDDLSDDPTDPTNNDPDGDGEPDDPTIVYLPGSISGTVTDENGDGIAGVVIELWEDTNGDGTPDTNTGLTATTDANGDYVFLNVFAGDYVIVEQQPADYTTVSDGDATPDAGGDQANVSTTDNLIPVSVAPGEADADNDFAEDGNPGSISGTVTDENGDGIAGVVIELWEDTDGDGTPDTNTGLTATTDANGDYLFLNVDNGDYVLVEQQPADYTSVSDEDTIDDGDPFDTDATVDNQIPVTVAPGEADTGNDFADAGNPGSISGTVTDENGDGIAGVVIELWEDTDGDGTPDSNTGLTATTDANGDYLFPNVDNGDYVVIEQQPADYTTVSDGDATPDAGGDQANVSTTDNLIPVSVAPGEADADNDFADAGNPGSISGTVTDENGDGIAGVVIELWEDTDGNGTPDTNTGLTATTDANGDYLFPNVDNGDYVLVEQQPADYTSVSDEDTIDDGDPFDTDATVDNQIPVSVAPGEADAGNDFAEDGNPGSISGTVTDENGDGIAGVVIELWEDTDGNGTPDTNTGLTATTDANGDYLFPNVDNGDYVVIEQQPADYTTVSDGDTTPDAGGDQANVSTTDNLIPVSVAPGEADADNDFAEDGNPGSISGTVTDENGDGIAGVVIELWEDTDGDGTPDTNTGLTATTDANGDYLFPNVDNGDYVLVEQQPADYTSVSDEDTIDDGDPFDTDATVDNQIPVTVAPGEADAGNDFAEDGNPGSISGTVTDENGDGIAGVVIELWEDTDGDGTPDTNTGLTATTDANGDYLFPNVDNGDYVVIEQQPADYTTVSDGDATPDAGGDQTNVSTTDNLIPVSVAPGEADADNDFAEDGNPGSISGTVTDENGDGIAGVVIELWEDTDGDGTPDTNTGLTATTDVNGDYLFPSVDNGDYVVIELQPDNYSSISDGDATPDAGGDQVNTSQTDNQIPVSVAPGEADADNDFSEELDCIEFELWVYLEGSLIVPQTAEYQVPMRTTLNDSRLLPGQYSANPFTGNIYTAPLGTSGQVFNVGPWNYDGGEGLLYDSGGSSANADAGYPSTVTDWVLVSLRTNPEDGSEAICQRAALLHNDGRIEFVGDDCCKLDPGQSYYIVVEHRNHLIVMSHEAVPIVNGKITYDFRDKQSYVNDPFNSGSFIGQKEVLPGVFAMFAGNGDQTETINSDTDINASDFAKWLNNGPQNRTFNLVDYNMDGDVSALDFDLWQSNSPGFTSVKRD